MTDLEEKIREYGLTPEQYESCLSDAYQKANRTLDMDWSEIIDKYGLDIHFDTLRKATQTIFGGAFVSEYFKSKKASYNDDTYLAELRAEKHEIRKEKQKLFDERTALTKLLREQGRMESMFDIVKRAIEEYKPVNFNYTPSIVPDSDNDLIIHLTDIHGGVNIDSPFNVFNMEVLEQRLKNYLDEIVDIQNTYKSQNAYVIIGGDLIQGLIHTNARIEAKENIVMQIMEVTDLVSNFIYELHKIFQNVEVHTTAGNHSRSTANKEETVRGENFDLLVPFACKKDLKNIENVKFVDNYLDCDIAAFKVRGHMVYATHGDKDTAKNVVYHMTQFARKARLPLPDLCYLGHRHTNGLTTVDDVKVIESGCVDGMDSFAIEKRLVGTPEQTVTVVTAKKRIKALCDIQID